MPKIYLQKINKSAFNKIKDKIPEFLSEEELKRANKFKNKIDRESYIIGRYLIKKTIFRLSGIGYNKIELKTNKYGRPYLFKPKIKNFDFNLSHSGNWIVLGIIQKGQIGVDIEKIRRIDLSLAEKLFSKKEAAYILGNKKPLLNFYKIWTLKESYVKASGKELATGLKNTDFRIKGQRAFLSGKGGRKWLFKIYSPKKGYSFSVCWNDKKSPIKSCVYKNHSS